MQSRIDDISAAQAEVLAVSVDPIDTNRDLARKAGAAFALLSDPELEVIDAYGVRHEGGGIDGDIARPATFIIDRQGQIVWRDLTDNWRIRVRPERILQELASVP